MESPQLHSKKLALFFTLGVSLKIWDETGLLDREIKPYNKLAKVFNKIYFFTYGNKEDLKYRQVLADNIVILPKKFFLPNKLYSLLLPFLYRKELRASDILKTNQMAGSWAAVLAKWFYGKKLVVRTGYQWSLHNSYAGWFKKKFIRFLEKLAYKKADKIIVTSDQAQDYITEQYGIDSRKIEIISNYIDVDLFKPLAVNKIPKSLCFIGRLEEQKNLFALLEAMKELDIKLFIFGKGEQEKSLKNFVQENNLKVNFEGRAANQDLPKKLNQCEAFILPSLYEGNPKTLLEAMAIGLPVIGTNVRGINNIIQHKINGYLCETSADSIRKAIMDIMTDGNLRDKIGREARRYILNNASLEKVISQELKLYMCLQTVQKLSFRA